MNISLRSRGDKVLLVDKWESQEALDSTTIRPR